MKLTIADDDLFLKHECPPGHPERPERLAAARRGFVAVTSGPAFEVVRLEPRDATVEELGRAHDPAYVERLAEIRSARGYLDPDTFYSPRSHDAAVRASGAALSLVESVLDGPSPYGFGLVRPPGHHACVARAMGFCMLNHAGVAARHAQKLGAGRVLLLDWDVHHGNGSEDLFWNDSSVLYLSLHQSPQYPGTGRADDCGGSDARGFTVNVPLSANATDAVYAEAFERLVLPVAVAFAPDLVIISAGFDAHARDPLGGMSLTDAAFGWMTAAMRKALPPATPAVFLLEGGYDLTALEGAVASTLRGLFTDDFEPTGVVSEQHERELGRAFEVQRRHWTL